MSANLQEARPNAEAATMSPMGGDALAAARGFASGVLLSIPLWAVLVWGARLLR